MNTITEARHDGSGSEATSSQDKGGSGAQPKTGLGELWLAIAALAAVVGLVAALALGAFDSSSEKDTHVVPESPETNAPVDSDAADPTPPRVM